MYKGFMYVKGEQFRTVTIERVTYIDVAALNRRVRNPNASVEFYTKVEELLAEGKLLSEMRRSEFPSIKYGTYKNLMYNIRRLSKGKEPYLNTKNIIRKVNESGCPILLDIILQSR